MEITITCPSCENRDRLEWKDSSKSLVCLVCGLHFRIIVTAQVLPIIPIQN